MWNEYDGAKQRVDTPLACLLPIIESARYDIIVLGYNL